jgi:hypothetical protein
MPHKPKHPALSLRKLDAGNESTGAQIIAQHGLPLMDGFLECIPGWLSGQQVFSVGRKSHFVARSTAAIP